MAQDGEMTVLLAGQYQNGKSTFINCLLGGEYAKEGAGLHTTAYSTKYTYSPDGEQYYKVDSCGCRTLLKDGMAETTDRTAGEVHFEAEMPSPILKRMSLVDAPGYGANDTDDRQAELALQNADFVVYLSRAKQLAQGDKAFFRLLKKHGKYFCVVLNVPDGTDPQNEMVCEVCHAIAGSIKSLRMDGQFIQYPSESGVCVMNLLWAKYGQHLLDAPGTDREAQQAEVVCSAWNVLGPDSETLDHAEVLEASGFRAWRVFLDASLGVAGRIKTPTNTSLHEVVASSICENLVRILKRS